MKPLPPILLRDLEFIEGFNKEDLIAAHRQPAVTSVRLHPLKGNSVFTENGQVPWCNNGRYLDQRPVFTTDPLYHAGAYYVQEASSMFLDYTIRQLVPVRSNLRVLDLCAAPGGKSTLIASLLERDSLLISNEVIRTRASVLEENITRWGYMNNWVTGNDPRDFGKLSGYFDVIVVDAPCSGSGLFRKDERALDEWSESNVQHCAQRQQRILADVWPALKNDGILIYATCSYAPQEDEEIADWLANNFSAESLKVTIPAGWGIVTTQSPQHKCTGYRFFPHKVKGEGFFLSAFKKKDEAMPVKRLKFKTAHDTKAAVMAGYLLQADDWVCLPATEGFNAIAAVHEEDLQVLSQQVYIRKWGIHLGSPVKNDWLPSHEAALAVDRHPDLPVVPLDKEQALKFLKKEDFGMSDLAKGWYVVTYQGRALGWIKALGNRINNYLPKHWRIRMEITDADWA